MLITSKKISSQVSMSKNCNLKEMYKSMEKAMAPHSSVLAWRIPGTGEPGGLPSMGSPESDTTEAT